MQLLPCVRLQNLKAERKRFSASVQASDVRFGSTADFGGLPNGRPFYPGNRTSERRLLMSATGHERTHALQGNMHVKQGRKARVFMIKTPLVDARHQTGGPLHVVSVFRKELE
jgi:hypothetical protein